jgi:hypothetical protein
MPTDAKDRGEYRQAVLRLLKFVQELSRLLIDEVSAPASGTCHRLIHLAAVDQVIGKVAVNYLPRPRATVCERCHRKR